MCRLNPMRIRCKKKKTDLDILIQTTPHFNVKSKRGDKKLRTSKFRKSDETMIWRTPYNSFRCKQ